MVELLTVHASSVRACTLHMFTYRLKHSLKIFEPIIIILGHFNCAFYLLIPSWTSYFSPFWLSKPVLVYVVVLWPILPFFAIFMYFLLMLNQSIPILTYFDLFWPVLTCFTDKNTVQKKVFRLVTKCSVSRPCVPFGDHARFFWCPSNPFNF